MVTERYRRWMVYQYDSQFQTNTRTWVFDSEEEAMEKEAALKRDGIVTRTYRVAAIPRKENNG